jgi:hypothetical protein
MIFPVYRDVAAMRASGKLTALQIKAMIKQFHKEIYKAPASGGVSYMLAPIMRVYTGKSGDETVMTMNMPHYSRRYQRQCALNKVERALCPEWGNYLTSYSLIL